MDITVEDSAVMKRLQSVADLDLTPIIERACLMVENAAKEKAPVGSGTLRGSITHKAGPQEGEVGTSLFYAPYVEYGTGLFSSQGNGRKDVPWYYRDASGQWHSTCGRKPKPFLIPAYEENKAKITKMIKDYIKEALG